MTPDAELAVVLENRLVGGGGGDFPELGARELDERGRGRATQPLQHGEHGQQAGRRHGG